MRYFAEGKSRLIYEEFTLADGGSRENGDVAKDLFCEAPVLTGAPPGNVAWFEQALGDDPGVCAPIVGRRRFQR